jgi:hypothetical protein
MRTIIKKPSWKHVTFTTSKLNFLNWAKGGINVVINEKEYKFKTEYELEALRLSINPSYKGNDTCFIPIPELKSIYAKTQERMQTISLLNGKTYNKEELIKKMYDDNFYYGELGKYALSSSAIKSLIDSPKSYARSLNFSSDSKAFKVGRLIHLAALEPEKLNSICHIVEVQSENTKKFKDKVAEIGSDQFVYTRKDYDKSMYTVDALMQNDVWQKLTRGASFEKPGFDILHGYPFRAKADVLGFDYIADLKTTADLKAFPWSAKKYGYDVQVYIYCNIFKVDWQEFVFFAIDKSTGDLGIYDVTENFYNSGKEKLEYGLKIYEKYFIKEEEDLNSYVIKGTLDA